jgi:DNA-binding CsgD family transcriptional regulator
MMSSGLFGLDEQAELVYWTALARRVVAPEALSTWLRWPVEHVRAAVETLVDQGLFVSTKDGGRFLYPDEAAELRRRRRADEAERVRAALAGEAAAIKSGSLGQYAVGRLRPSTTSGVTLVTDAEELGGLMAELHRRTRRRVDFLAPLPEENLHWENRIIDRRLADRKIRMQGVWFEREFAARSPSAAVRTLAAVDGVRTVDAFPMKAIVWDGRVAVVPRDPADFSSAALLVAHPGLVASIGDMVDRHWARGRRFSEPEPASLTTRHRAVLALLVQGFTDDAIARRLGIGERTVRRDAAQMSDVLGVSGRVALGAEAVRRKLVD